MHEVVGMGRLLKALRRKWLPATRGGYPAHGKTISELKPPPKGPGPGGKRPSEAAAG
jgi:hypothetical protein